MTDSKTATELRTRGSKVYMTDGRHVRRVHIAFDSVAGNVRDNPCGKCAYYDNVAVCPRSHKTKHARCKNYWPISLAYSITTRKASYDR